jgi:hypothetical protein
MLVTIEENKNLVRDTKSMAILNIDEQGKNKYYAQKEALLRDKRALKSMEEQMENLRRDFNDFKEAVGQCLLRKV